ncbi:MAG: acylphosphatase [Spirochaetia bacterium]|nr:acylphosphatase [Spirochaetia bacterium]
MERAEIIAKGKVQGVGFRNFVYSTAINLKLKGYTLNLKNGDVQTIVEGEKEVIEKLILFIKKGNTLSIVENVEIIWNSPTGEFRDFVIRR